MGLTCSLESEMVKQNSNPWDEWNTVFTEFPEEEKAFHVNGINLDDRVIIARVFKLEEQLDIKCHQVKVDLQQNTFTLFSEYDEHPCHNYVLHSTELGVQQYLEYIEKSGLTMFQLEDEL